MTFDQWLKSSPGRFEQWEQTEVPENRARIVAQFQKETGNTDFIPVGKLDQSVGGLNIVSRGGKLMYEIDPEGAPPAISSALVKADGKSYVDPGTYNAQLRAMDTNSGLSRWINKNGALVAIGGGIGLAATAGAGAASAAGASGGAGAAGSALPESYWSMLAEGGATATDAAAAGAGTVGGAAPVTSLTMPGAAAGTTAYAPGVLTGGATTAATGAAAGGGFGGVTLAQGAGLAATLAGASKGGGTSTNTTTLGPRSPEELEFIQLQTELAQNQLKNLKGMEPFQQQIISEALQSWKDNQSFTAELNKLITPQQRAQAEAADFTRAQRMGTMQDELLQMQLETARRGGAATPEQLALIKQAADAGIEAGNADIDLSTQRGIGLISDELANSRGLRLTDSPIMNEAGLLARSGADQKANLSRSLRANQANAALNYPLAVQGLQSQMNLSQQNIMQSASQFQAELRNKAYQNRLALTGQASNTGLGLASINAGAPSGGRDSTTTSTKGIGLQDYGAILSGIGALSAYGR